MSISLFEASLSSIPRSPKPPCKRLNGVEIPPYNPKEGNGLSHRKYVTAFDLQVLVDGVLESTLVGTDDLTDLLTALEEQEGRHGPHIEFLGKVWDLVDVDLVEFDLLLVFFRLAELGDLRGDDFAGTTPSGEAVKDDQSVRGNRGIEG